MFFLKEYVLQLVYVSSSSEPFYISLTVYRIELLNRFVFLIVSSCFFFVFFFRIHLKSFMDAELNGVISLFFEFVLKF